MAAKLDPPEPADTREAARDRSSRFSTDDQLRRFGFQVDSRPARGPVTWARAGRVYTQSQAQGIVRTELLGLQKARSAHKSADTDRPEG